MLQRLLGVATIPEPVLAEYAIRAGMFHRSGSSGPLGPLALIDLIRFCGIKPPDAKPVEQVIDWMTMPHDGSVRVESRFFGSWEPGVYMGYVENGTLAVRLDADPTIRECRRDMVRLSALPAPKGDTVSLSGETQDKPDARAALLDSKPVISLPGIESVEPDEIPEAYLAKPPNVDPDYLTVDPAEIPAWKSKDVVDWASVKPGEDVWVEGRDDLVDGKFVYAKPDGELVVNISGQEHTVPAAAVTLVAAPVAA